MSALIIGEVQRAKIAELIAFAAATGPFHAENLKKLAGSEIDRFRDMMNTLSIELPIGFHVTYSHVMHSQGPQPGRYQCISISVERRDRVPSPDAIEVILEEFGMHGLKGSTAVWVEQLSHGLRAVNVVQPV